MDTPEFLLWAIEYSCPVRGDQDGSDPERAERQLRAARAYWEALRENRVFEGLAVQPPDGFRLGDALQIYGGESAVAQCCASCPANAGRDVDASAICGCYGIVPLPLDPRPVYEGIEQGVEIAASRQIDTRPRWYGLWLNSPLWAEVLFDTFLILEAAPIEDRACRQAVAELRIGLNTAFNLGCRLHVRLYPRGRVEGTWWRLVRHCPRCQAGWEDEQSRRCQVCDYVGHPAPEKKRRARGLRPYFPLDRLLGPVHASEFLARYAEFRARRSRPGQEQSPPRPAPPGSRPDGSGS